MWTEHSGLINYAYDADTGHDKTVSMTSIVELTAGEEVMLYFTAQSKTASTVNS